MKALHLLRMLPLVAGLAAVSAAVQAQTPPIKPGLWQVHSEREVDGKKAPDMSERYKAMSPEMRERMEAAMKQRGVDMSGGGSGESKVCLSRESLSQGAWQDQQSERCKTDYIERSNRRWAWHTVCTQPTIESEGEALITSAESYTVKNVSKMERQGKTRNTQMTITAKWLGADCGDLKPISPGQLKPPAQPKAAKP